MRASSLNGEAIDLSPEALHGLSTRLQGPVLAAGEVGYDEARRLWNGMIERRPAAVVRCRGTADVIECVRFAREHDLLLSIKGGGHHIAGLALADGAVLLDLSAMRGVWLDRRASVAHAQPGCLLRDLDRETQLHGLAAVLGFVSTTGIAGLTLGGGFGYLSRRWGWTTDNVRAMELVTAEGRLVHASDDENPDLFWALRGGGGNFGVVTGFTYALHPVGPEVIGGVVAWPASEAEGVLELYRALADGAPPELTLVAILRRAPPAPWLPADQHGQPIVAILACHSGGLDAGERAVAPIKAFGSPIADVLTRRPYTQLQALLDATQPEGRRSYWKSDYLGGIDQRFWERIIEHAARIVSPHSSIIVFQLGGAVQQHAEDHSPVGNRDARYVFNVLGSWERPEDDSANIDWARRAWSDLTQFSTGGTYLNFLTDDEGSLRTRAALGRSLPRLAEVKARWDPDNVFRVNRNIRPG
jgi:FAD/FMN-containing dehydrogenase